MDRHDYKGNASHHANLLMVFERPNGRAFSDEPMRAKRAGWVRCNAMLDGAGAPAPGTLHALAIYDRTESIFGRRCDSAAPCRPHRDRVACLLNA